MKACREKVGADPQNFTLLVRLAKDGSVKVLLFPRTKVSQCLRETLLKDKFSPPPQPDHWVNIDIINKR